MHRVYPSRYRERMVTQLYESLPAAISKYAAVSNLNLSLDNFRNKEEKIKSFYDEMCNLSIRRWRGFLRIGPPASSKLLHFIFPNLFVIWDRRWVRGPQGYGESPDEYYRYLSDKRELLEGVVSESGKPTDDGVKWLILRHSTDLGNLGITPVFEPITRLLDEINFDRSSLAARRPKT